ncbi:leukemia inhibitory factor [Leptodactylus fuscus]|uniref:leukemia inhibitory factor n=1 Tax=Leptodactylus fuscus TaxID=238119 RepID=UPI003F4E4B39
MQLVAGVVQLLIFQHLALLMARAKSLNDANKCNDSITSIMSQIHSLIMTMQSYAKERFDIYSNSQNFNNLNVITLCHPEHKEFPKFSLSSSNSEEDTLTQMYKIFHYMNAAMGNITQEQMNLNPKNKNLHSHLNASKGEIAAVISNLSCVLNKRYSVPKIDLHYTMNPSHKIMIQKANGCKILWKYKHFLKQAVNITSDWENKGEYTQDRSSDKQTPGHR